MDPENSAIASIDARLRALVAEAICGNGPHADNPVRAIVLQAKWTIETYGITADATARVLDFAVLEIFLVFPEYRTERKLLVLCIIRAFLKRDTVGEVDRIFKDGEGLGRDWDLLDSILEVIDTGNISKPALWTVRDECQGLSSAMQCKLLSNNPEIQMIMFQLAKIGLEKNVLPYESFLKLR